MCKLEEFIANFIGNASLIILLTIFNKDKKNKLTRSLLIVTILTFVVVLTDFILPPFDILINYGCFFFLVIATYRKDKIKILMEASFVLVLQSIIQFILILMLFTLIFKRNYVPSFYNNIIINIGLLSISLIIYCLVPIEHIVKKLESRMNVIYFLAIDLLIYVIGIKLIWQYFRNTRGFVSFMLILLLSCCVNLFLCQYRIRDLENKKNAETYERYAPIILNYIEEVRQRQHDFKNHLNAIYGLVQVTEEGILSRKIKDYIQSLNYMLKDIDQTIYIDNKIVSAIIYIKLCEAKNRNIQFSYLIDDKRIEFPLKEYEMSEMICNLIDNAFEAVESLDNLDRIVNLEIGQDDKSNFIIIKNTYKGFSTVNISKMFEKGFSTKNKMGRGYGLYNVKKIVQNYNGSILVVFEDNLIVFNILFNK